MGRAAPDHRSVRGYSDQCIGGRKHRRMVAPPSFRSHRAAGLGAPKLSTNAEHRGPRSINGVFVRKYPLRAPTHTSEHAIGACPRKVSGGKIGTSQRVSGCGRTCTPGAFWLAAPAQVEHRLLWTPPPPQKLETLPPSPDVTSQPAGFPGIWPAAHRPPDKPRPGLAQDKNPWPGLRRCPHRRHIGPGLSTASPAALE